MPGRGPQPPQRHLQARAPRLSATVRARRPRSFTGEDLLELHVHGGLAVGAAADMLSKGRREFGPHFTPKMPLTQAPVAPVPPARSAVSEADLPTGLESLRKALRGPHQ